ncbi:MAG: methyltransferase, partial [Muribaculaceae bacterium]|nr:methyltransferase [Muribaculaceae bacterium]
QVEERAAFRRLNPGRVCSVATVGNHLPSRVLVEFTPARASMKSSQLVVRDSDGGFTEDFRRLTHEFYLKM